MVIGNMCEDFLSFLLSIRNWVLFGARKSEIPSRFTSPSGSTLLRDFVSSCLINHFVVKLHSQPAVAHALPRASPSAGARNLRLLTPIHTPTFPRNRWAEHRRPRFSSVCSHAPSGFSTAEGKESRLHPCRCSVRQARYQVLRPLRHRFFPNSLDALSLTGFSFQGRVFSRGQPPYPHPGLKEVRDAQARSLWWGGIQ